MDNSSAHNLFAAKMVSFSNRTAEKAEQLVLKI
jgi:hypothetical protein